MRRLIAYLTAFILAVSCTIDLEQDILPVGPSLEGAPVTVTFSVPDVPVLTATKALEDGDGDITGEPYLDPEKMYLVVCGGSQSIKYIRKAKLIETTENYEIPEEYFPLTEGDRHTTLYTFKVQLELSDFTRTIHILGNVDENQLITGSYSYQSLPGMLSYDHKQAYWQKLQVPYIKAKIDPDTHEPIIQNGSYIPTEETEQFFKFIPLIRNFAKIQVTNASENFQLHSYAVIFFPMQGSVVPFRSNANAAVNSFDFNPPDGYLLSGYEKSTFEELEDGIQYLGNMPASVSLSDVIPPASEFVDPSTSEGRVLLYDANDDSKGFYIYERGVPTDKIGPTFIIVCGKFEDDDNYYYYRLDLMESKVEGTQTVSRYYPIYRNFRYNILLHRISSEGVLTPELAAVSSGAEDISADISMRHLSDISNGTTRLVVEPFMTRTYSGPSEDGFYELYARFFNDVNSDVPNLNIAAVRVELEPMEDGSDDILILYDGNGNRVPTGGFFFPEAATVGGVPGIRTIHFNTVNPLDETKTQKIKITGHNPGFQQELRLYREVEITLQKKQPLIVSCTDPVLHATNTAVTLDISVPAELPQSSFPLEFIIEPEAGTLTPDITKTINLPVVSGRSIATEESVYKDTPAFYFLRTLSWEEYSSLPVNEGLRTFSCYFKTTRGASATAIWVYNEYFSKARASFENEAPPERPTNHFWVRAIEDCTVKLSYAGEYKIDDGEWTSCNANQSIPVSAGHKISLCAGSAASPVKSWSQGKFSCSGSNFEIGGNIASIVVGDDYPTSGETVTGAAFLDFLKANTGLKDAYELEIPMKTVSENAYKSMFDSCTSLKRGPQILPATNLGKTCYRNMFYNCSNLENAPVLAATKLAQGAYQRMFYGCAKINYIKMLGTQNYRDDEFISDGTTWSAGVAATGEIWLDSSLNPIENYSSTWGKAVPDGWTVKYIGIDDQ
ncbi:MAG: hypothetical protein IJU27_03185 [Bacteroidales bacterium]|nr:hypothetical protein [Bacteroidales bacterium]